MLAITVVLLLLLWLVPLFWACPPLPIVHCCRRRRRRNHHCLRKERCRLRFCYAWIRFLLASRKGPATRVKFFRIVVVVKLFSQIKGFGPGSIHRKRKKTTTTTKQNQNGQIVPPESGSTRTWLLPLCPRSPHREFYGCSELEGEAAWFFEAFSSEAFGYQIWRAKISTDGQLGKMLQSTWFP